MTVGESIEMVNCLALGRLTSRLYILFVDLVDRVHCELVDTGESPLVEWKIVFVVVELVLLR